MANLYGNLQKWKFFSQRQRMSPFPNSMSMESVCREIREYVGIALHDVLVFFKGNIMNLFLLREMMDHAGKHLVAKIEKNPALFRHLIREENHDGKALVRFTKEASQRVNARVTNHALYRMFEGYERHYKPVYARYGSVWIVEDAFMKRLFEIVESKSDENAKRVSEMMNVLTSQPSAMVNQVHRRALLHLAVHIATQKRWAALVREQAIERIVRVHDLKRLIQRHVSQFFWLTRDYEDPILTFEDIVKELSGLLARDVSHERDALERKMHRNEKRRHEYIRELRLTKHEIALFDAMRDIAHLKELRKRYVSESLYSFDAVLMEIARRTYLTMRQVRFMRTSDVKRALIDNENLTHEVNDRIRLSVWNAKRGAVPTPITGKRARALFEKFVQPPKDAKEFTGMPVSPGKARGPVKIVMNPDECDKVKKGDVIVSVQVVPSFSSAIMRASALLCDGGHGITTHPATLAREAGIPAIIQTRFAREVLKDGDMVEVDGYKGIARRL